MQLAKLDWDDPRVWEEQLTGVDFAYFREIIERIRTLLKEGVGHAGDHLDLPGADRRGDHLMLALNDRQQAILAFIQEHIASKGYAPSVRDIHALGLCALHTLTRDLVRLTEAGAIQRDPGVARGIRLPEAANQTTGQLRALVAAWETLRPDMDIARSQAAANMDRQVGLARELLHERRDHAYR
ncbi:MAG: hypothetical protein V9H69_18370 [Anaerolineae bacterium]